MFARGGSRAAARAGCAHCRPAQPVTSLPARPWCNVRQPFGRRCNSSISNSFKTQFRKSPIGFPFAVASILAISGWAAYYIPWYYQNVIVKPYHKFPEPVAKKLRKALFYSRGSYLDIREANKYFRQALAAATAEGMDPFSDEIMGVKYLIAHLFEENGYYAMACDVLEIMRSDCQRWMDEFSDKHWNDGNRARVKKNMVQINVKLGELYNCKYVNEPDDAEKRLVEAVESVLEETQRRKAEGLKPGEGPFMTDDEVGATLEALASHYEQNDAHYLALPLFLRALELNPPTSCHGVVLMNNISTCLAQQTPPPASTSSPSQASFSNEPAPPRSVLVEQAHQWANKALARAASVPASESNDECHVGCAVATHNLGEFFEMEGKIQEARQKYQEAASMAKAVGFAEGQHNARSGLSRLKEMEKKLT